MPRIELAIRSHIEPCTNLFRMGLALWHGGLSHHLKSWYPIRTLVEVTAVPLLSDQLPANVPEHMAEDDLSIWIPTTLL